MGVPTPNRSAQDFTGWSGRHPDLAMHVSGRRVACENRGKRGYLEVAMTSLQRQEEQKSQVELTGCMPLFLWLSWMAVGNAVLFLCAALVAKGTAPPAMDIIFFMVALGLIVVRYVDIT